MKILVFDTCFKKSYIVLKDNGKILANEVIDSTESNYHSAFVVPKIRDILRDNNLFVKDLDAIGVNTGPGSFTGIRAGITIARVLAQQANLKLAGVSSLQILARLNKTSSETIVVLDARKNQLYFAKYLKGNEIIPPCLINKNDLLSELTKDSVIISDLSVYSFLAENNINSVNYENNDLLLGLYLSDIVEEKLLNSEEDFNREKVKPLYIQKPSITMPKELKNV